MYLLCINHIFYFSSMLIWSLFSRRSINTILLSKHWRKAQKDSSHSLCEQDDPVCCGRLGVASLLSELLPWGSHPLRARKSVSLLQQHPRLAYKAFPATLSFGLTADDLFTHNPKHCGTHHVTQCGYNHWVYYTVTACCLRLLQPVAMETRGPI